MKNRKKVVAFVMLVMCVGAYCIASQTETKQTAKEDIPLHDGDVLVTSDDVTELENSDTYFQEMRATLEMERNKIIELLSDSEGSSSTQAEKEEAAAEKMRLLNYMEQEKTIETLIQNKNLPECFVVISDSGVNVTVNSKELDQSMVTKITEIILRETDRKASELVIQGTD
jgi:nicotinic acid phosphoribosyltransferase